LSAIGYNRRYRINVSIRFSSKLHAQSLPYAHWVLSMLTFIVPVRHPQNARDWSRVKQVLKQTATSIAGQESDEWRAVVVANTGSDLPPLPPRFSVAWVDFPPNPAHDVNVPTPEDKFEIFRYDKGQRVAAGLVHAPDSDYYMVVDDDDFVSSRLAGFAARHPDEHGWYIGNGYCWSEGSQWTFAHPTLHKACGTTHILHRDLMKIPLSVADAPRPHVRWLGQHGQTTEDLVAAGTPLQLLPFPGSVYRIGHGNAHSLSRSIWRTFILRKNVLMRPYLLVRNSLRLKRLTPALIREFGMGEAVGKSR